MKKVIFLIIFTGVFFACNKKWREQSSTTDTKVEDMHLYSSVINSKLLYKACRVRKDFQWCGNLFYDITLFQRNDSNFVYVFASLNPPSSVPPPPRPPSVPFSPPSVQWPSASWMGFISIGSDYFLFYRGENVSDDFLATIVQYDVLNTCKVNLESLADPFIDHIDPTVYTFFVNEQGCFIFKRRGRF